MFNKLQLTGSVCTILTIKMFFHIFVILLGSTILTLLSLLFNTRWFLSPCGYFSAVQSVHTFFLT